MMHSQLLKALGAAAIGALTIQAGNLITNGTFEGGNITGWTATVTASGTTTGSCNDGFAAQTTAAGCVTGLNPTSGSYAAYASTTFPAITNSTGQWSDILNQNFIVPANVASAILSWSDSAVWTAGSGNSRGVNVVAQLYLGTTFLGNQFSVDDPTANGSEAWTNHTWDVSTILKAHPGATLTLEMTSIAFYDTRTTSTLLSSASTLNTGFDNIALNVVAPEPATLGLTGIALVGLGLAGRRRHYGKSKR